MNLTVYTSFWCRDCREAKNFLTKHNIPFDEIDIETTPGPIILSTPRMQYFAAPAVNGRNAADLEHLDPRGAGQQARRLRGAEWIFHLSQMGQHANFEYACPWLLAATRGLRGWLD